MWEQIRNSTYNTSIMEYVLCHLTANHEKQHWVKIRKIKTQSIICLYLRIYIGNIIKDTRLYKTIPLLERETACALIRWTSFWTTQTTQFKEVHSHNAERRRRERRPLHPQKVVSEILSCFVFNILFSVFYSCSSPSNVLICYCSSWTNRILAAHDHGAVQVSFYYH